MDVNEEFLIFLRKGFKSMECFETLIRGKRKIKVFSKSQIDILLSDEMLGEYIITTIKKPNAQKSTTTSKKKSGHNYRKKKDESVMTGS